MSQRAVVQCAADAVAASVRVNQQYQEAAEVPARLGGDEADRPSVLLSDEVGAVGQDARERSAVDRPPIAKRAPPQPLEHLAVVGGGVGADVHGC
jgi:hypothetical protein